MTSDMIYCIRVKLSANPQTERGGKPLAFRPFVLNNLKSAVRNLLLDLSADFAARIGRSVDVDVELAGQQIGGLGIGQRGAALGRARSGVGDCDLNAGILAGFGRAVE